MAGVPPVYNVITQKQARDAIGVTVLLDQKQGVAPNDGQFYALRNGGLVGFNPSAGSGGDAAGPVFFSTGGLQGLTAPALVSLEAKDLTTVTVTGAKRGDMVIAKITSAAVQYNAYRLEGYVTDDNATVTFRIQNLTASPLGSTPGLNIRYKVERYTSFPANP